MQVHKTKLQNLIDGQRQYNIPVFQRSYRWERTHWETFWDDLLSLLKDKEDKESHFMGCLVVSSMEATAPLQKLLLIDGQQRLITIFVLMTSLRDKAQRENHRLAEQIDNILTNKLEEGTDSLKILPTTLNNDKDCFMKIIQQQDGLPISKIADCYNFFKKCLDSEDTPDLTTLRNLIISRLELILISLDPEEDPYKIFESLNAKGEDLSAADLIRNHFFMRIGGDRDQQEQIYENLWKPMEERLTGNDLSEYIRHFLMKDGAVINKKDVYFALKKRLGKKNSTEVIESLKELSTHSVYYEKLLKPEQEEVKSIRERLLRLNNIEVTVAYPFFLNIYRDYDSKSISKNDFAEILDIVENFLIRRFICNIQTHGLNKIFPYLYEKSKEKLIEGIKRELSLSSQKYPKDSDFKQAFKEVKLYVKSGEAKKKGRVILERLELHENKEPVDFNNKQITIEHIMPQEITDWWKEHLGDDWKNIHDNFLHTIGNLTLSASNSENSNHPFPDKKKNFEKSNLKLNKWLIKVNEWNERTIQKRAEHLAEMALEIWKYFGSEPDDKRYSPETVKGTKPISVVIKGNSYPVSSWRDVMIKTTEFIIANNPKTFDKIIENHPQFLSWNAQAFTRNHCLSNDMYLQINWSASAIVRFCIDIMKESGFSKEDWHVES